jgi:hypothetical protein
MRFDYYLYLKEARDEVRHLEHIEDLFIQRGFAALNTIKEFLGLYSEEVSKSSKILAQIKVDGSPAMVFGVDPLDRKFFLSTKSAFNINPKLAKSLVDVRDMFQPDLAKILSKAFIQLRDLKLTPGEAYQADFIFSSDTKIKKKMDGEDFIAFKPNVIEYAVSKSSPWYSLVDKADVGLVVHTKYNLTRDQGIPKFKQLGLDFNSLTRQRSVNLFIMDNVIRSCRFINVQLQNKEMVFRLVKEIESETKKINDFIKSMKSEVPSLEMIFSTFINNEVFTKDSNIHDAAKNQKPFQGNVYYSDFIIYVNNKLKSKAATFKTAKKQDEIGSQLNDINDFLSSRKRDFIDSFRIYYKAICIKYLILEDLKRVGGIFDRAAIGQTEGDEGIVLVSDRNIVKIVDRTGFSRLNRQAWNAKK